MLGGEFVGKQKSAPEFVEVVVALRRAGYEPLDQLKGYLESVDSSYITRKYGARDVIERVDKSKIRKFLDTQKS